MKAISFIVIPNGSSAPHFCKTPTFYLPSSWGDSQIIFFPSPWPSLYTLVLLHGTTGLNLIYPQDHFFSCRHHFSLFFPVFGLLLPSFLDPIQEVTSPFFSNFHSLGTPHVFVSFFFHVFSFYQLHFRSIFLFLWFFPWSFLSIFYL